MRIKKQFTNKSEYLDFVWNFVRPDIDKVWREEDRPLLDAFFVASQKQSKDIEWSEVIQKSFDHYQKCREEYADELFEIKDSVMQFTLVELLDFFFLKPYDGCYDIDDDGNEIDENGNVMPPFSKSYLEIEESHKIVFPMFFIGVIESGFDRNGNYKICFSDFVSLEEFSKS